MLLDSNSNGQPLVKLQSLTKNCYLKLHWLKKSAPTHKAPPPPFFFVKTGKAKEVSW